MIENVTDQLHMYAHEVAEMVNEIEEGYDLTKDQAIKVVQIAVEDMKTEVFHHYSTDGFNLNNKGKLELEMDNHVY